jgi:cell division protein FtsW
MIQKIMWRQLLDDKYLVFSVLALVVIGLLMVASASMVVSEQHYHTSLHFLWHQCFYLVVGLGMAWCVVHLDIAFWEKRSHLLLIASILLLVLVLIPGIGHQVNGSTRWIHLGFLNLQVSEIMKLVIIIYLAKYLVQHQTIVRTKIEGFLYPMILLSGISLLLLLEPDFGATAVILLTALSLMYLAGVRVWQFGVLLLIILMGLALLALTSPYRLLRLTAFLNPWQHQFDSGYQLTQSLIAFGRGGVGGVGLGESVQKLFYLPEAHTDFLFAVLGEELGLIGIFVIMGLYLVLVLRALWIGRRALSLDQQVSGYIAYGIGLWIAIQSFINVGVNIGILPTKGLTLPLMSYGGSSMLIMWVAVALLCRIDYETKFATKSHSSFR